MNQPHLAQYETVRVDGKTWERAPFGETPFGYCPTCGSKTHLRELAPGGKARCLQDHEFWAAAAKPTPPEAT